MSPRWIAMSVGALVVTCVCLRQQRRAPPPNSASRLHVLRDQRRGEPFTQAGGHPFEVTSEIVFNTQEDSTTHFPVPVQEPKDISSTCQPGLVGDRQADAPLCPHEQFVLSLQCPGSTQVGVFSSRSADNEVQTQRGGVYNSSPKRATRPNSNHHGKPQGVLVDGGLRTGEGYGLRVGDADAPIVGLAPCG